MKQEAQIPFPKQQTREGSWGLSNPDTYIMKPLSIQTCLQLLRARTDCIYLSNLKQLLSTIMTNRRSPRVASRKS